MSALFDPSRMPARIDGEAVHPDAMLPEWFPDGARPEQDDVQFDYGKLRDAGWEVMFVRRHEDEPGKPLYDVPDEHWFSAWNPERPGWTPIAYFDTEEGPVAIFVRRTESHADA